MTKVWLVGTRSNFFDDFRDVAEEASPTDTELIDLDNLGLALGQPGAWIENLATREQVIFFIPVPGTPAIRQAIHQDFAPPASKCSDRWCAPLPRSPQP